MKDKLMNEVMRQMLPYLDNFQMKKLQEALSYCFYGIQVQHDSDKSTGESSEKMNEELLAMFISSKQVEGCSEKTLKYYRTTLKKLIDTIDLHVTKIQTEDLRDYLSNYQKDSKSSNSNIDNIRRILSSFFSWLEDEDYILKSPMRRIHKIRTGKTVKETYTDENLEMMRDECDCLRDLAMVDFLASTGIRVGELVGLDRSDIDFENRECVVVGKGNKERTVYFDARTKIHLKNYLSNREDENQALFVSLLHPNKRLEISGVEIRLRKLGQKLGIDKVHPHKFRRTLATKAIDKGMPVEQVQQLLGHSKIDTTMQYAMVNQVNVKNSHRKFIG